MLTREQLTSTLDVAVTIPRKAILLLLLASSQSCANIDVGSEHDSGIAATREAIRGGTNLSPITGVWENIGTIVTPLTDGDGITQPSTCTATIISEYTALTAAHCGNHGATSTFTGFNSRGTITGIFLRDIRFSTPNWFGFDFAVIRFSTSIHNSSTFNGTGLTGFPVHERFVPTTTSMSLWGRGYTNSTCTSGAGPLNYALGITMTSFNEDWQYELTSSTYGGCKGDSGGPDVAVVGGQNRIVAVNSWITGNNSYFKPVYMASRWIYERSTSSDISGDLNVHCRIYDTGFGGASHSLYDYQDQPNLALLGTGWNNRISAIWVKKGFEFTGYDGTNYTTYLGTGEGFAAGFGKCTKFGCYHDLMGTSMDNKFSSLKCDSALPGATWGDCILYDHGPDWSYLSLKGNHSSLASNNWDNRASQIWVKHGHSAVVYPAEGYQATTYWGSSTLSGSGSGDLCNAFGCLHDLVETLNESTISSIQCL